MKKETVKINRRKFIGSAALPAAGTVAGRYVYEPGNI